ncbi:hypothetical protein [Nocardia shimofusensis]|uniref:hypothetical protein n=1 Tax=Nocardia shimofusensis TaxID=228596 RepID=UPI00082A7F42|nr:hypothetical protein [Nocardia shimofusensis]
MKSVTLPTVVIGGYAVFASFACAVTVTETILFYPNVFHDVPHSLELTEQFMSAVGVGDVLRPMGAVLTLVALAAAAVAVRSRLARGWIAASAASLITGQFLLSVAYQWPRVDILFDDRDRYSTDELRQAADEFLVGQALRVGAGTLTAVFSIVAALVCYRAFVLTSAQRKAEAALD